MATVSKTMTGKAHFNQEAWQVVPSILLFLAYCLAIKRSLVWIQAELGGGVFVSTLTAIFLGFIFVIWKFGPPKKSLPIPALGLIGLSGLLSILTFPILQQLSASFALLGFYGFFASLSRVSPGLWRKGLIMGGLSALALPFALVPGTGMGFYLRLLTADTAAQILALIGHSSLEAHDVLIFDNGIAQVDLPCSGLKSLFTGTAFFFVASLLLRREVNFKWMIGYSIFAGLLIVANTFRVTILIWVSEILQHRDIAETIHMPLGLMLFCIVCLCGVFILYKMTSFGAEEEPHKFPAKIALFPSAFLSVLLAGAFLLIAMAAPPITYAAHHGGVTLPSNLTVTSVGLTPTETRFFGARDRTSADKWMFEYQDFSGSMLVVRSRAANGLHAPEVCMLGNGISVDQMQSRDFGAGQYRFLTVDNGRRNAVYWMQGEQTITDDFRKRLSRFVFGGEDDWVMVTLLFDDRLNLDELSEDTPSLENLMQMLQSHYSTEIRRKRDENEP